MDNNQDLLEREARIIRLSEKMEAVIRHCDEVTHRINHDLVTRDRLAVVETELKALKKEVSSNAESSKWLIRGIFMAMLSTAAGLFAYLLQRGH